MTKIYPLCVLLMSCGDLDSKSSPLMSQELASKKQLACSPTLYLCMFQHELFLDFFFYSSLCLKVLKCHPSPPSLLLHLQHTFKTSTFWSRSRHTCPWCHVFQEMTALKYRLSKNNKQSEPEYLPCVHSSSKHHCARCAGWCSGETSVCYRLNASDLTFYG